jgi:hypothetical protein
MLKIKRELQKTISPQPYEETVQMQFFSTARCRSIEADDTTLLVSVQAKSPAQRHIYTILHLSDFIRRYLWQENEFVLLTAVNWGLTEDPSIKGNSDPVQSML